MKLKLLTIFLLFGALTANAQKRLSVEDSTKFAKKEVLLEKLSRFTMNFPVELGRKIASDSLIKVLPKVLAEPNSFYYPFDSMKTVFRLKTEDNKFRIFTWAFIDNLGKHHYRGFVQYNQDEFDVELANPVVELKLGEHTDSIGLLYQTLKTDNWYGALYYQAKKIKIKRQEYYILLGYNGNDRNNNVKVIDVMTIGEDYQVEFGAPLFYMGSEDYKTAMKAYKKAKKEAEKYEDDPIRQSNAEQNQMLPLFNSRVLFYSADDVNMTLRFEKDGEFIIWDHLVPNKGNVGEFSKYYPDGTYDYLKFKKKIFLFQQEFFVNEKI